MTHREDSTRCYHFRQSRAGSNGNEMVLRIPQSIRIPGASSTDCLISFMTHVQVGSYHPAPADWLFVGGGVLSLCKEAVSVYFSPSRLNHQDIRLGWGVLTLCREAVCVFCSPSRLGHQNIRL